MNISTCLGHPQTNRTSTWISQHYLKKNDEELNIKSFFQLKVRNNIKTQNEQKLLLI
jgi:hypothetical protein